MSDEVGSCHEVPAAGRNDDGRPHHDRPWAHSNSHHHSISYSEYSIEESGLTPTAPPGHKQKGTKVTRRGFEPLPSYDDEKPLVVVSFRLSHTP
jgi:hypothetical protein